MLSRLKRWWRNLFARHNRLWATQVVSSVAAVLLALAASWGAYFVAEGTFPDIERETLDDLLTVIASSMLAVTTFSLSIMVGAFGAAAGSATPRATLASAMRSARSAYEGDPASTRRARSRATSSSRLVGGTHGLHTSLT